MTRSLRSAILGLAAAATVLAPAAGNAEPFRHRGVEPHVEQLQRKHHRHRNTRDDDLGAAIALGIIGLAVGAMIASSASEPDPYPPQRIEPEEPDYFPPPPGRNPDVVYAERNSGFEPWSAEWFRACNARYQTFDDRTGTYMGYDRRRHFCVID